jgi:Predicted xylanase/chitin deacetylase
MHMDAGAAAGLHKKGSRASFMRVSAPAVPVVMLHSVADDRPGRPRNFILYNGVREFESFLRYLRWRSYKTLTLKELFDFLDGRASPPSRSIVLTFDDGYLDNWVAVAPLLRRYGFTGTIFVPTDFIQGDGPSRPTLEDVWAGRIHERELAWFGYVNEAEIRALAASGTLDVQSHARTHTWLPSSDEVLTFHHPNLSVRRYLRWMWWNRFPERKPFWFQEISHRDLPWGTPIFRNDLALAGRAFLPNPELVTRLVSHVESKGGELFFGSHAWHEELSKEVEVFRRSGQPTATVESSASFEQRLRNEIEGSRLRLEAITGRPVQFLCWPNGGVCEDAFQAARRFGYLATTIPSRMARGGNRLGDSAHQIRRISSTPFFHGDAVWPKTLSFGMQVERARGNVWMNVPIKLIWAYRRLVPVRRPVEAEI